MNDVWVVLAEEDGVVKKESESQRERMQCWAEEQISIDQVG